MATAAATYAGHIEWFIHGGDMDMSPVPIGWAVIVGKRAGHLIK
jgi:hypothetical protein